MTVRILIGDVRDKLRELPADSVDCVVTSPPYWGLRDYGVAGQIGMERTLGEHIETLVDVFREVRRVAKPTAAVWLNYGDCYATSPNGRSAADTKALGNDDRTFRDKPFSTIGPIYDAASEATDRRGKSGNKSAGDGSRGRINAGGYLKPKDLCLIPFRLAIALQEDGWWVRSRCVWGKPNGMPDSSGRWRPSVAHEEIFLLSKSGDLHYDFEAAKKPAERPDWSNESSANAKYGSGRANTGLNRTHKQRGHSRRHQGFNDRWDQMSREEQQENGRLLRTYEPEVWHIATAAFRDAHFATFPPALVERCLTASCPEKVCAKCGAAWVRDIVTVSRPNWKGEGQKHDGTYYRPNPGGGVANDRRERRVGGLEPSCDCAWEYTTARGVVLDPFGGAGTVGLVATAMHRDAILIELNPAYADIARRRIEDDAGLLFGPPVEMASPQPELMELGEGSNTESVFRETKCDPALDSLLSYNAAVEAIGERVKAGDPVPDFFRSDKDAAE